MLVSSTAPCRVAPRPKAAILATPNDAHDIFIGGARPPQSLPAATSELQYNIALSPLKNFMLGSAAVLLSKTGALIEKVGQKMHLWSSLGQIHKPLPPSKLTDLPDFRVERPLIFVPGFQTPKDRFDHMVDKLTQDGRNGGSPYYVRDGQFYSDIDCTHQLPAPGPEAKVFVAVFHSTDDTPVESAPQLDCDLKAIQSCTGTAKVDAIGYSMGGLASRQYLDKGGDAIGRLMMVATPNQGSELSELSLWLLDEKRAGRDVGWIASRKPLTEDDRAPLEWLRPSDGPHPNQPLLDLNSRWPHQSARLEGAMAIGSGTHLTSNTHVRPVKGDGTVPASSLKLPGLPVVVTTSKELNTHGLMNSKPEVYLEMAKFLHWSQDQRALLNRI